MPPDNLLHHLGIAPGLRRRRTWRMSPVSLMRTTPFVDGPRPGGPGGMYLVRVARHYVGKEELDRLLKEFQSASNLISMAVPTE